MRFFQYELKSLKLIRIHTLRARMVVVSSGRIMSVSLAEQDRLKKNKGRYINIVMKTRSSAVAEGLRGYVRTILRAYYYF